jgi:hypothetical protein
MFASLSGNASGDLIEKFPYGVDIFDLPVLNIKNVNLVGFVRSVGVSYVSDIFQFRPDLETAPYKPLAINQHMAN